MKKLVLLGVLLILLTLTKCYAEEATQAVNDNKAAIAVQKQPSNEAKKQKATNNRWCIIIQVNGKCERAEGEDPFNASRARQVKDTANPESAR